MRVLHPLPMTIVCQDRIHYRYSQQPGSQTKVRALVCCLDSLSNAAHNFPLQLLTEFAESVAGR